MKILTTIILMSIFVNLTIAQDVESSIKEIRNHYKWINSQKDFKTVSLNNQEFLDHSTDNGATMQGFFKDGKLYKIEETVGISYAYFKTEYYFWNDKLFFVYRTENQYSQKNDADGNFVEMDYTKTDLKYEDRQYFKDGKQIRRIEKGEMIGSKAIYPKDFVKLADEHKSLINNRYKYRDKYKKMQGRWVSKEAPLRELEIDGLIQTTYYDGEYVQMARIKIKGEGKYLDAYFLEDKVLLEYEFLNFSDKEFKIVHLDSGQNLTYLKWTN